MQGTDRLLNGRQIAELLGITPATWRTLVRDGYAPAADDKDDQDGRPVNRRMPRWRLSTVETFRANRPGRGKGRTRDVTGKYLPKGTN